MTPPEPSAPVGHAKVFAVLVGVAVGVGVTVAVGVAVTVGVGVALGVEVAPQPTEELFPYRSVTEMTPPDPSAPVGHASVLAVLVGVGVGVGVTVAVGVGDTVGVGVALSVGVGGIWMHVAIPKRPLMAWIA